MSSWVLDEMDEAGSMLSSVEDMDHEEMRALMRRFGIEADTLAPQASAPTISSYSSTGHWQGQNQGNTLHTTGFNSTSSAWDTSTILPPNITPSATTNAVTNHQQNAQPSLFTSNQMSNTPFPRVDANAALSRDPVFPRVDAVNAHSRDVSAGIQRPPQQSPRPSPTFNTATAPSNQMLPPRSASANSILPTLTTGPDANRATTFPPPSIPDPEPARIVSDIAPSLDQRARHNGTRTATASPIVTHAAQAKGPSSVSADAAKSTKYATDTERKQAMSVALKARRNVTASQANGTPRASSSLSPHPGPQRSFADRQSATTTNVSSNYTITSIREAFSRSKGFGEQPGDTSSNSSSDSSESSSMFVSQRPVPKEPSAEVEELPIPLPPEDKEDTDWDPEVEEDSDADSQNTTTDIGSPNPGRPTSRGQQGRVLVPPKGLDMTGDGRAYTRFDEGTGLTGNYGALLPTGYKLSKDAREGPWICPLRNCQKSYRQKYNLGSHFSGTHRGVQLHDCRDGSFKVLGNYAQTQEGTLRGGSWPAVVVSIEPFGERSTGISLPQATQPSNTAPAPSPPVPASNPVGTQNAATEKTQVIPYSQSKQLPPEVLWSWLRPHLNRHRELLQPPNNGWVKELITLPRVRDVAWQENWIREHGFLDSKPRDISALIVQVTGEPAPEPCGKCKSGKGPFGECIMISRSAHPGPLGTFWSCANCFYHHGQTYCTHKYWGEQRNDAINKGQPIPPYISTLDVQKTWVEAQHGQQDMVEVNNVGGPAPGSSIKPKQVRSYTPTNTWREGRDATSSQRAPPYPRTTPQGTPAGKTTPSPAPVASSISPAATPMSSQPQAVTVTADGKEPASFTKSASGRPYEMWRGSDGQLVLTGGVLLPDGYQLDTANPAKPWICPISTCRRLYFTMLDLGAHFTKRHACKLLNDNEDGTLSTRGVYRSSNPSAPCLVVSRNNVTATDVTPAISSTAPTVQTVQTAPTISTQLENRINYQESVPVAPSQPVQRTHNAALRQLVWPQTPPNVSPIVATTPNRLAQVPVGVSPSDMPLKFRDVIHFPEDMRQQLWKHLKDSPISRQNIPLVQSLMNLPRKRFFQENLQSQEKFQISYPVDAAAVIIHVTGDTAAKPCGECENSRGPFKGCVVISKDASEQARLTYQNCANCVYKGRFNQCSLSAPPTKQMHPPAPTMAQMMAKKLEQRPLLAAAAMNHVQVTNHGHAPPQPRHMPPTAPQVPSPTTVQPVLAANTSAADRPSTKRRVTWDADEDDDDDDDEYMPDDEAFMEGPAQKKRMIEPRQTNGTPDYSSSHSTLLQAERNNVTRPIRVVAHSDMPTSLISPGQIQPEAFPEMEDWEMAPGSLRKSVDNKPGNNRAFSKSFLATSASVPVAADVQFGVQTIKSGTVLRLDPAVNRLRLCSIASGKLRVSVGNEPEFAIGAHGMFKIETGEACKVENKLYVDAILHITTLDGF